MGQPPDHSLIHRTSGSNQPPRVITFTNRVILKEQCFKCRIVSFPLVWYVSIPSCLYTEQYYTGSMTYNYLSQKIDLSLLRKLKIHTLKRNTLAVRLLKHLKIRYIEVLLPIIYILLLQMKYLFGRSFMTTGMKNNLIFIDRKSVV